MRVLGVLGVLGVLACCVACVAPQTLAAARHGHVTNLVRRGPAPVLAGPADPAEMKVLTEPRDDARRVTFSSGGQTLFGYLMEPAGAGPHPAVLYAHSGFHLRDFDVENAKLFVAAGFVVFVPAWRGENGNPGAFELWYGEVDDAAAALAYLRTVPGVDGNRVYAVGHSAGGTLVLLLAELGAPVRAVATSGAPLDLPNVPWLPFDFGNATERALRAPIAHAADLVVPTSLFYGTTGGDEENTPAARELAARARGRVVVIPIDGADHKSAMRLAIPQMITQLR